MPITLSKIASNTGTVTVPTGSDEDLTVVYYPARLTEKTIIELRHLDKMESEDQMVSGFKSLNEALCHLIKSWDLYEDEDQTIMFPLDSARLAELPIFLRKNILDSIMSDIRPEAMTPQAQAKTLS